MRAMRPGLFGVVLLATACSQIDSFTPTITGLGRYDARGANGPQLALPFRICDVPTSFTDNQFRGKLPDPVLFEVLGSGFMGKVVDAPSNANMATPIVALEGPATYTDFAALLQDGGRIL